MKWLRWRTIMRHNLWVPQRSEQAGQESRKLGEPQASHSSFAQDLAVISYIGAVDRVPCGIAMWFAIASSAGDIGKYPPRSVGVILSEFRRSQVTGHADQQLHAQTGLLACRARSSSRRFSAPAQQ